jgi:hypothetical protein
VDTSGYFDEQYIDITVDMTIDTRSSFAHLVYGGPLRSTVSAVTQIKPRTAYGYGEAIIALNSGNCVLGNIGVQFGGNLVNITKGGGFFSNGCMDIDGVASDIDLWGGQVGCGDCDPSLSQIEYYDENGNPIGGSATTVTEPLPFSDFEMDVPPECMNPANHVPASTLEGDLSLSGLYCVTGDLRVNNVGESMGGTDVTFVFLGGSVTINGGDANLHAPDTDYVPAPGDLPAIPGVLFYLPVQYYGPAPGACGDVNQEIKINGNSGSSYTGTILAPCSDISIEGNTDLFTMKSQLIGWNVSMSGTSGVTINYEDDDIASTPTTLDLYR